MTLEQRLRKLESMIAEIYAVIIEAPATNGVDENSVLDRLCRQAVNGNREPLDEYCRRIGKQAGKSPVRQETGKG